MTTAVFTDRHGLPRADEPQQWDEFAAVLETLAGEGRELTLACGPDRPGYRLAFDGFEVETRALADVIAFAAASLRAAPTGAAGIGYHFGRLLRLCRLDEVAVTVTASASAAQVSVDFAASRPGLPARTLNAGTFAEVIRTAAVAMEQELAGR